MAYDQRKADAFNTAIANGASEDEAFAIAGISDADVYDYVIGQNGSVQEFRFGFGATPVQQQSAALSQAGLDDNVPTVLSEAQADAINQNVPGINDAQAGSVWDPNKGTVTTSWGDPAPEPVGNGLLQTDTEDNTVFTGQEPEFVSDTSDIFDATDPNNTITSEETITQTGGTEITGGEQTVRTANTYKLTPAGEELDNKIAALNEARKAKITSLRNDGVNLRDAINNPEVQELTNAREAARDTLAANPDNIYRVVDVPGSQVTLDRNGNEIDRITFDQPGAEAEAETEAASVPENVNLADQSSFAAQPLPPGAETENVDGEIIDQSVKINQDQTEVIDQQTGETTYEDDWETYGDPADDFVDSPAPVAVDDVGIEDFQAEVEYGTSAPEVAPTEAVQLKSNGTGTNNFNVDKSLPFAIDDQGRAVYGTEEQLLNAGYNTGSINLNGNPALAGTNSTSEVPVLAGGQKVETAIVSQRQDGTWQVTDQNGNLLQDGLESKDAAGAYAASVAQSGSASFAQEVQPDAVAQTATDQLKQQQSIREQLHANGKGVNFGDWRVRLSLAPESQYLYNSDNPGILQPLQPTSGVIFPYTPQISTNYAANYNKYDLTHSNFRGYFYQNSYVDEINITATFTAQDSMEAQYLLATIHFFKSVTKMFYGGGNNQPDKQIGAPPPLVYLTGLGDFQFSGHPCLVSNFQYTLPNNVDYIRAGTPNIDPQSTNTGDRKVKQSVPNGFASILGPLLNPGRNRLKNSGLGQVSAFTPGDLTSSSNNPNPTYVPTKIELNITLLPTNSRRRVSQEFSLRDYASGSLLKGGMW